MNRHVAIVLAVTVLALAGAMFWRPVTVLVLCSVIWFRRKRTHHLDAFSEPAR